MWPSFFDTLTMSAPLVMAILAKLAEIFEVPVSQLLGSRIEPNAQPDALAEQLARINEQLVIKNRRAKRIWTAIAVIVAGAILV